MEAKPQFPLTVSFHETNERWVLDDKEDAVCNLEWFDSEDAEERADVTDSLGRSVRLKIERLKILICELKE